MSNFVEDAARQVVSGIVRSQQFQQSARNLGRSIGLKIASAAQKKAFSYVGPPVQQPQPGTWEYDVLGPLTDPVTAGIMDVIGSSLSVAGYATGGIIFGLVAASFLVGRAFGVHSASNQ